jgi:hypothetical protein
MLAPKEPSMSKADDNRPEQRTKRTELPEVLATTFEKDLKQQRKALSSVLADERAFPQGFWHPDDLDGMSEVMRGCLEDLGIDPLMLSDEILCALADEHAGSENEDATRRHQIGKALSHVNAHLSERSSDYLFYAFAEDLPEWESEEPVWVLLSEEERTQLVARGIVQPPSGIEAEYSPLTDGDVRATH